MVSPPAVGGSSTGTWLLVGVVVLWTCCGTAAAAQSATGVGGTVVVESGERVASVEGVHGTVVVRGTVTGDVEGVAGTVRIAENGRVHGDVSGVAEEVVVAGRVDGVVDTTARRLAVTAGGRAGSVDALAQSVRLAGRVDGTTVVGADTLSVSSAARLGGALVYDARAVDVAPGAAVAGERRVDDTIVSTPAELGLQTRRGGVDAGSVAVSVVVGALLLGPLSTFSDRVVRRTSERVGRSLLVGAALLVAGPVVLALVGVTLVGLPLTALGAVVYAIILVTGFVYGQFLVGDRVTTRLGDTSDWLSLGVGVAVVGLLAVVPVVGSLLRLVVLLVGAGGVAVELAARVGTERLPRLGSGQSGGA